MALTTTITTAGDTATITLAGELDASSAPQFKAEVEQAAGQGVKKLVLMMQDLEYMASAGLRVLIFAKQKMGADTDIYLVGTQELVKETIEKTGFDQSVYMVDTYEG